VGTVQIGCTNLEEVEVVKKNFRGFPLVWPLQAGMGFLPSKRAQQKT
jgi:hypothetical protein